MLKQSHLCRKKVQYFIAHEEISQIQEASIVRIHHRSTVKKYSSKKITEKNPLVDVQVPLFHPLPFLIFSACLLVLTLYPKKKLMDLG